MKIRLILASTAALLATAIGLAAPEASTDLVYRLALTGFMALFVVSRMVAMGAFGDVAGILSRSSGANSRIGAREIAHRRTARNVPMFISDPGVRAGL